MRKKIPQAKSLKGCVPVLKVFYHHSVNKDKAFFFLNDSTLAKGTLVNVKVKWGWDP